MTLKELLDYVKENNVPENVQLRMLIDDTETFWDYKPVDVISVIPFWGNILIFIPADRKTETTIGIGKL
jgi:hypothetical protein